MGHLLTISSTTGTLKATASFSRVSRVGAVFSGFDAGEVGAKDACCTGELGLSHSFDLP